MRKASLSAFAMIIAAGAYGEGASDRPVQPLLECRRISILPVEGGKPAGWVTWTPRAEIAPKFDVDARSGRTGNGALRITAGGNGAAIGSWKRRVTGVKGGKTYRFSAWFQPRAVSDTQHSVYARLLWLDATGNPARPADYVAETRRGGGWTCVEQTCGAPENAISVEIELGLQWCAGGQVWWDDIVLGEATASTGRIVRAMTLYYRPSGSKTTAENVERFCHEIESLASEKPDLVCLPEGIPVVGTRISYADASEYIPGPSTARLGETARRLHAYVVAGIYEREGNLVYNTAVLIGRKGELIGKYRKTHLPREEVEAGITPGSSYPVFQTDFGKVGLMICWDVQFPEPARALALKGAEVLLLPIWGGSEVLARARAIENHAFLISSSYDMKTFIVDPAGEVLAEATKEHPAAIADLHLDRKIVQPWLGDMKVRTWRERRADIPVSAHR